ncbi:Translocation protein S62, partial [Cladochytrium tenue]
MPKPNFNDAPKPLLEVAKYLRSSSAKLKIRQGVLNGRRVDFFKGKHAVNAVMRDTYAKYSKALPAVEDRPAAEKLIADAHQNGFFLRVEKPPKAKTLALQPMQVFSPDAYYIWVYEGSQWRGTLLGLLVLLLTLAGVMFPLWPASLRLGVYYLSLALLGLLALFFGLIVVRFLL